MNFEALLRDLRPETSVAVEVVTAALELARHGIGHGDVSYKQGRDIVTTVDLAIEDAIRARMDAEFGMTVVGEEREVQAPGDAPHWVLDPICGTRAFASGTPMYSTNLALAERGEIVLGVRSEEHTSELQSLTNLVCRLL